MVKLPLFLLHKYSRLNLKVTISTKFNRNFKFDCTFINGYCFVEVVLIPSTLNRTYCNSDLKTIVVQ